MPSCTSPHVVALRYHWVKASGVLESQTSPIPGLSSLWRSFKKYVDSLEAQKLQFLDKWGSTMARAVAKETNSEIVESVSASEKKGNLWIFHDVTMSPRDIDAVFRLRFGLQGADQDAYIANGTDRMRFNIETSWRRPDENISHSETMLSSVREAVDWINDTKETIEAVELEKVQ